MTKTLKLVAVLLCTAPLGYAQNAETDSLLKQDNAAFVFTESQLGESDDVTQNVIMMNSSSNVYTSNAGYLFGPVRYKFRAYNSRYNDIYFNGVQVNNLENGQFNYSTIGGMNDATRNIDASSMFEPNNFSMSNIGGSSNYNLRASSFAAGQKVTLSGANRNYTLRAMYTYSTGLTKRGWAFMGTIGYRWANMNTAAVEGTFYNSLSYFLAVQKVFNEHHSLNLSTWGSPTERATQGASTDEAYWLANDYQYNPYWGYQDGKKRASRVVNNFEPTAMLTWDYNINERMKLTTSLIGKYAMYSSTKLDYNGGNVSNPQPDYYRNMPSYNYDVWGGEGDQDYDAWLTTYNFWTSSKANRQIDFDKLYWANLSMNAIGHDANYYIKKRHNDHLYFGLGSAFDWNIDTDTRFHIGLQLGSNKGMHYTTMSDLLGSQYFHNINTYLSSDYAAGSNETYYDLNNKTGNIRVGDRMEYDYNLIVETAKLWASYTKDKGISHNYLTAKIGASQMWRDGKMNNGLFANYTNDDGEYIRLSYGKSKKAGFLDGGFKMGSTLNLGAGNAISFGVGYETRTPQANVAFISPEQNNNFVRNLVNEKVFTTELGYSLNNKWVQLNLTAYYTHSYDGTEFIQYYNDNDHSFTYNSLTGVEKNYYGAELGVKFKITSDLTINLLGSIAEAKYASNTNLSYMLSTSGTEYDDLCLNKGMRESSTPLAVASLGIRYNLKGWYFNLNGNYYDRIYLSYSPYTHGIKYIQAVYAANNDGSYPSFAQSKGKGGFMLDGSIGHSFRIAHNPLYVSLMATNITNNRKICTGGFEQSRSDYTINDDGTTKEKTYKFSKNPKKYYAQGFNFMLNLTYRF
ncbi:MAG: TonB-dependent receptor [Bacteroidaceae bacterium]|nr:TonB-dependent receptor [Bacteroidaceae bacterium]